MSDSQRKINKNRVPASRNNKAFERGTGREGRAGEEKERGFIGFTGEEEATDSFFWRTRKKDLISRVLEEGGGAQTLFLLQDMEWIDDKVRETAISGRQREDDRVQKRRKLSREGKAWKSTNLKIVPRWTGQVQVPALSFSLPFSLFLCCFALFLLFPHPLWWSLFSSLSPILCFSFW